MKIAGIEFPPDAQDTIDSWKIRSNCIIQTMTCSPLPRTCPNCKGGGSVYLMLLLGDFSFMPKTGKPATWDSGYWHIIEKTVGFICPVCSGKSRSPTAVRKIEAVQPAMDELVSQFEGSEKMDYTDI